VARVSVEASPARLVVSQETAWVVDGVNQRLLRVDLLTRQVAAAIAVGGPPEQMAVGP